MPCIIFSCKTLQATKGYKTHVWADFQASSKIKIADPSKN